LVEFGKEKEEFKEEQRNLVYYNFFDTHSNVIPRLITTPVCYNSLTHPFWARHSWVGLPFVLLGWAFN
jgi:hypothetical protein